VARLARQRFGTSGPQAQLEAFIGTQHGDVAQRRATVADGPAKRCGVVIPISPMYLTSAAQECSGFPVCRKKKQMPALSFWPRPLCNTPLLGRRERLDFVLSKSGGGMR
jgi:hypothetical protein